MEEPILDPQNRQDFPEDFNTPRTGWWEWVINHNLTVIAGFLVLILIVVASLWFFRNQRNREPQNPNVILTIKGPETMSSGNESEFRVVYTNGENADLTNMTLEVFYPSNFRFVSADPQSNSSNGQRYDLPLLRQGQTGEVKIRGKLNGATGESKELRAKLTYKMSNFTSEFFTETNFKTTLTAPALEMEITGPIDVMNGQNTTFSVNYKNVSDREFDATAVELRYPEGFKFVSAVPAPSKSDNYWNLGKLAVGATGKVEISGNFIGDPGTEQQVSGDLGLALNSGLAPQIHASARFKIQSSTLSITQEANPPSVVDLGRSINYTLKFANFGSTGQSNVVLTATIEGASVDTSKIKATSGIVTGNTITWKSATLQNLALLSPNQRGDVTFTVPLKPNTTTNLKNQIIKTTTSIYSDQVTSPIRGQELQLKVASQLDMIVSGSYVSGVLPMQVGQTTSFNITLTLTNLSNDLSDTTVIASMPLPASAWANIVVPDAEKGNVTFDQNASKIRWRIGNLPAFTGKFTPARSVTFQLNVTPSEADRGKSMILLRDTLATGIDTFTNLDIKSTELNQLTVGDLNDDSVDSRSSTVQ